MRWCFALTLVVAVGVGCGDNIHPAQDAGGGSDAPGCTTECTAGQTTCAADGTVVTCAVDATGCGTFPSGGGSSCGAHQTCSSGASACSCTTDASCSAGTGTYCTTDVLNGDTPATYTCAADSDGCVYAQPVFDDCGAHQSCSGAPGAGACTCNVDAACGHAGAGTYCTTDAGDGGAPATYACLTDAQSCVYSDQTALADCGTHQSCSGTDGAAACTCNTDANCPDGAGSFCNAGDTGFTTCATDAQSCVFDSGSTTCTAPTSCVDSGGTGTATCTCPAAGTAAGSGCTTAGAQMCSSGGDVLTCEVAGACDVWVDTVGCAAAGLACGGGQCECPSPATGVFVADPHATAITIGGVTLAPDGAATPSGCRYPVLGDAIAAADMYSTLSSATSTVEIESASAGTFSTGETWPLVIPDRVTVTSDDTAVPATRYTLAPTADVGAAVIEDSGALDSVAITANITTATSPPAAVTFDDCSARAAGGVDALNITFAANATGAGIDVSEPAGGKACAPAIQRTTITGAYDGIVVSAAAGAATTTAAATITGTSIAGSLHDGVVVYQTAAAGVTVSTTTIAGSHDRELFLDTATVAKRTGNVRVTGTLGTTTIDTTVAGAEGIALDNTGPGETAAGARIDLTDVTVHGVVGTTGDAVVYHNGVGTLAGVVVQNAGARGLVVTLGGNVSLQDDGSGNHCYITASGGTGVFVDTGSVIGGSNVVVQSNTGWGIDAENSYSGGGGTETLALLTDWTVTANGTAANSDGGMTVAGTDTSNTTIVHADGCSFDHNAGFGFVAGANSNITLSNADVFDSNGNHGFYMSDASAQASYTTSPAAAPAFTNNQGYGIAMSGGVLSIVATAAAPVTVTGNVGDGIHITSDANLFAGHLDVASNGNNGVAVALTSGGTCMLSSSMIANNSASGIAVESSPVLGSGYSTTLETDTITGNAIGVSLGTGGGDDVSADLEDNTIEGSTGAGVLYNSTSTTCTLDFGANYIEGNGGTAIGSQTVGGVGFEGTPPASLLFANNTVGNDDGNEVDVYAATGTVLSYNLSGGNQFVECSTTNGFVALFAEAATAVTALVVDADNTQWANTTFPGTNTGTAGVAVITTLGAIGGVSCPAP